jgi:hypothetical protein
LNPKFAIWMFKKRMHSPAVVPMSAEIRFQTAKRLSFDFRRVYLDQPDRGKKAAFLGKIERRKLETWTVRIL